MSDPFEDTDAYPSVRDFGQSFFADGQSTPPVTFGSVSDAGKIRPQNEDHFAVFRFRRTAELLQANLQSEDLSLTDDSSYAIVVADGMGGMNSGELASRLALQTLVELTGRATSWVTKLTDLTAQQIKDRVDAYVTRIHQVLRRKGETDPENKDMGTTWTSAHLLGRNLLVVHLGDSRAYLYRNGQLRQITHDETLAQSLIDGGMEPESVHTFRHVLVNAFGGGNETVSATIYNLELRPADQLLLCTDGLTDMVTDAAILAELAKQVSPQEKCDSLLSQALDNGGKDNITVVVAEVDSSS